jgi:hypothetical protein
MMMIMIQQSKNPFMLYLKAIKHEFTYHMKKS